MEATYLSKIPLDTVIAIISLAISIGGFVPFFLMHDRKKEIAIFIALATLVVISGIVVVRGYQHDAQVKRVGKSIIDKLGYEAKTIDQLHSEIRFSNLPDLNEALDSLVRNGIAGYKVKEVYDDSNRPLLVTVYFQRLNR